MFICFREWNIGYLWTIMMDHDEWWHRGSLSPISSSDSVLLVNEEQPCWPNVWTMPEWNYTWISLLVQYLRMYVCRVFTRFTVYYAFYCILLVLPYTTRCTGIIPWMGYTKYGSHTTYAVVKQLSYFKRVRNDSSTVVLKCSVHFMEWLVSCFCSAYGTNWKV